MSKVVGKLVLTGKPSGGGSSTKPGAKVAFQAKPKASFGDEEERKEAAAREEKMRKMMDEVHAANAPHVKQLAADEKAD